MRTASNLGLAGCDLAIGKVACRSGSNCRLIHSLVGCNNVSLDRVVGLVFVETIRCSTNTGRFVESEPQVLRDSAFTILGAPIFRP